MICATTPHPTHYDINVGCRCYLKHHHTYFQTPRTIHIAVAGLDRHLRRPQGDGDVSANDTRRESLS